MTSAGLKLEAKIAEMRSAFDASFAAPVQESASSVQLLLAIQVAGEFMAVRVADVASLTKAKSAILPVPSSVPELLGLTAVRGTVVPVFSLTALLGIRPRPGAQESWLLLCSHKQGKIALAFDEFEKCLEVGVSEIFPAAATPRLRPHVRESVRHKGVLRAVIHIESVLEHLGIPRTLPAKFTPRS